MNESLLKFMEIISNNADLKNKMDELVAKNYTAGVVALAASVGIEFAEDDLVLQAAPSNAELDDDELDAVAGGWTKCYCAVGGGGKADGDGLTCACVAAGMGLSRRAKEAARCACALSGAGQSPDCMMLGLG